MATCVLVPVYRERPEKWEVVSLEQLAWRLGSHHVAIVAPKGLNIASYTKILGDRECHHFDSSFFRSRESYSALMVNEEFYREFVDWEHVLVHQTDAFVFEDQLDEWSQCEFDYIGSPLWHEWGARKDLGMVGVGNGGFSLRRVEAILRVLRHARRLPGMLGLLVRGSDRRALRRARQGRLVEDRFWGIFAPITVAPLSDAVKFAFETGLEYMDDVYRELVPFGCHAVWNLTYIENLRRGVWSDREPDYQRVLYGVLERSGNL